VDGIEDDRKKCLPCHSTGMIYEADQPIERVVGCEACHGPGESHIRNPQQTNIINPARLSFKRANDICFSCHSTGITRDTKKEWPEGYKVGDNLSRIWQINYPDPNIATKEFFVSGFAKHANMQGNEYMQTRMWQKNISCTACHISHGSEYSGELVRDTQYSNALCLICHNPEIGIPPNPNELSAHTHHPAIGSGSSCVECHMPLIKHIGSKVEKRSHRFKFILPASHSYNKYEPNACLNCHKEKSTQWVIETVRSWSHTENDEKHK
jgi:predicted CXXCH cytochrome family protein